MVFPREGHNRNAWNSGRVCSSTELVSVRCTHWWFRLINRLSGRWRPLRKLCGHC